MRPAPLALLLLLLLLLAACTPRVTVVDATTGAPLAAQTRELASGNLLIEAEGYETWSGPPRPRVGLHPLWIRRFSDERIAPSRLPPPPCPGCPDQRSR